LGVFKNGSEDEALQYTFGIRRQSWTERAVTVFTKAFEAHGAGRLDEAERGYRRVLAARPDHADAWHLLGMVEYQRGRPQPAVDAIQRALKLTGPHALYLSNLGIVLESAGRHAEAKTALERAVALDMRGHNALYALGNTLRSMGLLEEAAGRYRQAIAFNPSNASAHNNLGNTLKDLGRLREAEAAYRHTIALLPTHARAHYNLGVVFKDTGRPEEAAESFRTALAIEPDLAEAHTNLGVVLHDQGHLEQAIAHARRAIAINPQDAAAHNNLGTALRDAGEFEAALESYAAALALRPNLAEARHNEGVALQTMGRDDEALERYKNAQHVRGAFAEAEQNAALLMLMRGDFAAGWAAYESRWRTDLVWRSFPYPLWQGEDSAGTVLIWGEQGVGDRILYAGMIPDLLARGQEVVVETDPRLIALFERSFPGVQVVGKTDPPHPATLRDDIRWYSPLASLGRWLRPDLGSFPKRASYLVADEKRRAEYRALLEEGHPRLIVGISWISRSPKTGDRKTLALERWAPLLRTPGVRFVDLQYGDTAAERLAVEEKLGISITHIPGLDLRDDIDGVAALAKACDLVISVSSSVVHVAAAVGCPTWVLVPAAGGNLWYWMREADHTPWYSSVTIFRQDRRGEWQGVLQQVADHLQARLARPAVTAN